MLDIATKSLQAFVLLLIDVICIIGIYFFVFSLITTSYTQPYNCALKGNFPGYAQPYTCTYATSVRNHFLKKPLTKQNKPPDRRATRQIVRGLVSFIKRIPNVFGSVHYSATNITVSPIYTKSPPRFFPKNRRPTVGNPPLVFFPAPPQVSPLFYTAALYLCARFCQPRNQIAPPTVAPYEQTSPKTPPTRNSKLKTRNL